MLKHTFLHQTLSESENQGTSQALFFPKNFDKFNDNGHGKPFFNNKFGLFLS